MSEVKERPILFSAPMVQAILAGRKTQTRRVVKGGPYRKDVPGEMLGGLLKCPYGQPGERLWVRETWRVEPRDFLLSRKQQGPTLLLDYAADRETGAQRHPGSPTLTPVPETYRGAAERYADTSGKWRSPLFMPRWASRLTLEITGVRVERLQDISEADAVAEGIVLRQEPRPEWGGAWCTHYGLAHEDWHLTETKAAARYRWLWQEINAKRGHAWESNPWVWVIEFRKVDG